MPDVEPLSASELHMSHGSTSNSELEEGETASIEGPELPPVSNKMSDHEDDDLDAHTGKDRKKEMRNGRGDIEKKPSKREVRESSPTKRRRTTSEHSDSKLF